MKYDERIVTEKEHFDMIEFWTESSLVSVAEGLKGPEEEKLFSSTNFDVSSEEKVFAGAKLLQSFVKKKSQQKRWKYKK